ncbi:MAG: 2-amino-4-hydroxy-6-hydroxymethyldihydropteridine diphosphokinase [Gemmatimonadota bacterium]
MRAAEVASTAEDRFAGASHAALSLGSNLGQREASLAAAREALAALPHSRLLAASAVRETVPQGVEEQPLFLNQVLLVRTLLSPWELLEACLAVERELGRVRGRLRWGPRTIDVDVLAYDGLEIRDERLGIPHPALPLRPFFLDMLHELGAQGLLP